MFPSRPRGAETDEFRQAIDWRTGTISGHGRLTAQGADLIRRAALFLQRAGHARIVVDLHGVGIADAEGLAALGRLTDGISARSWELLVLQPENLS